MRRVALVALTFLVFAPVARAGCGMVTSPASGSAPLAVTLSATCPSASYTWDFGDGQTATGQTVQHVYTAGYWHPTLTTETVPAVAGMREAAEAVAQLAPPDTNVAFWGSRDGTFVYAMRAYSGRRDLGVVRLDKILLSDVAVYVEHGFKENIISPDEMTDTLRNLHVQYVVFQTRYYDDLASVKTLEEMLGSDKFSEVERIPMTANYGKGYMADLVIYRMKAEVPRGRVAPSMQLKVLGRSL